MPFLLALIIVMISVAAVTYKTYMGYGEYPWYVKGCVLLLLIISLSAPFIGYLLHHQFPDNALSGYTKVLYFLFGFVFILFLVTLLRDVVWAVVDVLRHISLNDMKDVSRLQKANIVTFILCLMICFYGYYEAEKEAPFVTHEIVSSKIQEPTKIIMLADLHIDVDTPTDKIKNMVEKVNKENPDAIVLVGDVGDNNPMKLKPQLDELQKLQAKSGVYAVLGNHEFYNSAFDWGMAFAKMQFNFLNNYGMALKDRNVYIAGIPDINAAKDAKMPIKTENALYFAKKDNYVIMLSHAPLVADGINKDNVDLILSAHTHGGQVFPFHYFTKQSNQGRLAGFYDIDGVKMYISRGTRYWGVPMRLLAPSEITIFNLLPQKK